MTLRHRAGWIWFWRCRASELSWWQGSKAKELRSRLRSRCCWITCLSCRQPVPQLERTWPPSSRRRIQRSTISSPSRARISCRHLPSNPPWRGAVGSSPGSYPGGRGFESHRRNQSKAARPTTEGRGAGEQPAPFCFDTARSKPHASACSRYPNCWHRAEHANCL